MGDVPAAVDRRADDGRNSEQGAHRQHLPPHSSVGVQHGPPVDGRGVHAQVLIPRNHCINFINKKKLLIIFTKKHDKLKVF